MCGNKQDADLDGEVLFPDHPQDHIRYDQDAYSGIAVYQADQMHPSILGIFISDDLEQERR
ncbi:MAG: hypothetical protein K9N21_19955 [Deltaproteobacteria bacterium]|nr:hypothetical protein [Deltaproteobacteria bacterium]